jgi:hypothetical protein
VLEELALVRRAAPRRAPSSGAVEALLQAQRLVGLPVRLRRPGGDKT